VGRHRFAWLLLVGLLACSSEETKIYDDVRGVVRGVQPSARQLVVQHEDIPGLMPAMTMNFGVAKPELLDQVRPGQVILFRLAASRRGYYILELEVIGEEETGGASPLEGLVDQADPAPPFELTDQEGRPLALSDLEGKALLLDFVFTRCPGPCPVLTGIHVDAQRALPDDLRASTWFVSISLDPEHDRPEALNMDGRAIASRPDY